MPRFPPSLDPDDPDSRYFEPEPRLGSVSDVATDAPNSMLGRRNKRNSQTEKADTMAFYESNGHKGLVGRGRRRRGGIVADWHLAASPSPSLVSPWKPDNLPRVEVVRPRRATVAQRLQTNATLEAFEENRSLRQGLRIPVRCSRGYRRSRQGGQVLAVIDVPEMKQELAESQGPARIQAKFR